FLRDYLLRDVAREPGKAVFRFLIPNLHRHFDAPDGCSHFKRELLRFPPLFFNRIVLALAESRVVSRTEAFTKSIFARCIPAFSLLALSLGLNFECLRQLRRKVL